MMPRRSHIASLRARTAVLGILPAIVLSGLLGCGSRNVTLGRRDSLDGSANGQRVDAMAGRGSDAEPDADDQDDEALDGLPCASPAQCVQREEPYCSATLGRCVECLRDSDCRSDQRCERDGECDTPEDP